MGMEVTNQNVDQVLSKFQSFVEDADAKANWGKGAVAYLFPGLRNAHLETIDKPIFASRSFWRNSSVFRSEDDKRVNNYVRHLFLNAIAAKLKCAVNDVPRVFEWAGKLKDLKIDDFNASGRPLTARRIGTILEDLKAIEMKRLVAVDVYEGRHNGRKAPSYYANAGALSAHKVSAERQAALPQFEARFSERHVPKANILHNSRSDNSIMGEEMMAEQHAKAVGDFALKQDNKDFDKLQRKIDQYKEEVKTGHLIGKKESKLSKRDKDFREIQIKLMQNMIDNKRPKIWVLDSIRSEIDSALKRDFQEQMGDDDASDDESNENNERLY